MAATRSTSPDFADQGRRTVLITGASRGLGRAIAEELAPDWHILVGGRDPGRVRRVVDELPSAEAFCVDLADQEATAQAAGRVRVLDALVHSAAVAVNGPLSSASRADWRAEFEINLFAVADLTRLLLPLLRAAHGQVVLINSGAGLQSSPLIGVYAASKFALRAYADTLREEERGRIRVTSVHPGRMDTDMLVEQHRELDRPYHPERQMRPASVAATVRMALEAAPEVMIEMLSVRPVAGNSPLPSGTDHEEDR